MPTARELMTEAPTTIRSTAKVRAAADLLQSLDVRHLPVTDDDGALVGMLSDRDLRSLQTPYVVAGEYVGDLRAALDASVATIMSADPISVDSDADASEVVELMLEHKVGAVPVTNADGALVGIISYMDVLRAIPFED